MKKFKLISAIVAVSVLSIGIATPAAATGSTKLDLVQDCSTGCPEPTDMMGPTGFGFVVYNQDANGDLRIVAKLKGAEPNETYVVLLANGPTHAATTGFAKIGTLTTNVEGNGVSAIRLSHATLQSAPFGVGNQTNHIDLRKDVNDTSTGLYDVTGINYEVKP